MKKEIVHLESLKLVGITARTNNQAEMSPETGVIPKTIAEYDQKQLADRFQHRASPKVAYCVYTEFESDHTGDYTYFVGEAVNSFEGQDSEFKTLDIPAGKYVKFTTDSGPVQKVVIDAWMQIWQMTETDFGGKRTYIADFELYDIRCKDPTQAVVDIYLGIE